uniref:Uncharacterized protein n=1 Tax=viral metagenome TaxID=1070528 RepID=A0A6H1ZQL8_9ZZZZ
MSTRYIQAAVSDEDHDLFTRFAGSRRITLSDLVEVAVKQYIKLERKEEERIQAETLSGIIEHNN